MTRKEKIAAYRAAIYPLLDELRMGFISPDEFAELHRLAVEKLKKEEERDKRT